MNPVLGQIPQQSWMITPETVKVMACLNGDGGEARFVGGCVRDSLVNRPVIDIDIATTWMPELVMERLEKAGIHYVPTGLQHGTVTAIVNGQAFEITTLRRDIRAHGRHADVVYTDDWAVDAGRRDFTFNALYASVDGVIYDYYGGMTDLQLGRTIFVGSPETRILEDHLRILRYFRFFAHYGRGEPDPIALWACENLAKLIPKLSSERIRQEVLKLLTADRAGEVWEIMLTHGVVTYFLPEATNTAALQKLIALESRHGGTGYVIRRLAALLETTTEGLVRVTQLLRLSRAQAQQLVELELGVQRLKPDLDYKDIRVMVYHFGNDQTCSLLLLAAAKGVDFDLEPFYETALSFRAPRLPIIGRDVMAAGVPTGPRVGEILKEIESWWLDLEFEPGRTACLKKLDDIIAAAQDDLI